MQTLTINGNKKEFQDGELPSTLSALLEKLKVDSTTVVAEVDGRIIERQEFSQTKIKDNQKIELVRFVPGG